MKTSIAKPRIHLSGLSLAALFVMAMLINTIANAHQVISAAGQPTHTHVYKKTSNGVVAGHAARPAGSNGIVIWQSAPGQSYQRAQSGMRFSRDPWSKKKQQSSQKKKSVFTKNQSRAPKKNPQ